MYFDLSQSPVARAVRLESLTSLGAVSFWRKLFGVGTLLVLAVLAARSSLAVLGVSITNPGIFWGFVLVFLPVCLSLYWVEVFIRYHVRRPEMLNPENIAEHLDFEAARILGRAGAISVRRGEGQVSTDSLIMALLSDSTMQEAFARIGVAGYGTAASMEAGLGGLSLRSVIFTADALDIKPSGDLLATLELAETTRQEQNEDKISRLDFLPALFKNNNGFKKFILDLGLDRNDLMDLADWYEHIEKFRRHRQEFWSMDNLLRQTPIGKDWVYGFAPHLSRYARDITEKFKTGAEPFRLIQRKGDIDEIEEILARAGENNVLLVGEEGVGKRYTIEDFARRIAGGKALPALNYKKVLELDLASVGSASKEQSDVHNLLVMIMEEAVKAGNVILVIENLHNFVGAMSGLGRIDVAEVILPYLQSSRFQVLATTDPASFHKHIESRQSLLNVFEKVAIDEPDVRRTVKILQENLPAIEYKTKAFVSYSAMKAVVDSADKYIRTAPFPEKAFDLLSEAIAYSSAQKRSMVTVQDVNEVVSRKTGIPLGPIVGEEKKKLSNLEGLMREQLVGQDRAIEVIAATMRRLRTGMARRGKPAGVFLFVGPTGVGKTETAKILARTYFGSEDRMLRFDMSEYQELESMDRFIGSLRMNEPGQFTTMARDNPFALILLDELEKANKNILNIFLQVFDEAHLTDAFGRKVSFEQHIIIATSNAGADLIREMVQQGVDPAVEKEKIIDVLVKGNYFRPEFVNRFDEVVIFHPLSEDQVYKVAEMAVNALVKRMAEQDYIFKPTADVIEAVAKAGFDPQFGARPIQRAVKDKLENLIAKKILEGTVQKGEEFELSASEIS